MQNHSSAEFIGITNKLPCLSWFGEVFVSKKKFRLKGNLFWYSCGLSKEWCGNVWDKEYFVSLSWTPQVTVVTVQSPDVAKQLKTVRTFSVGCSPGLVSQCIALPFHIHPFIFVTGKKLYNCWLIGQLSQLHFNSKCWNLRARIGEKNRSKPL